MENILFHQNKGECLKMKKFVFLIAVFLIWTVFNPATEAHAVSYYHQKQNAISYTGSTSGDGATFGYYNQQYNTVAVKKS